MQTQLHLTGRPPDVKKDELALAGQNIDVVQARELVAATHKRPWQGDSTVIHITAAHRVKESVWNTLLKALEEPPDYVVWHLYAPSSDALPGTIRSRAHITREHLPDPIPEDATRIIRMCESADALVLFREADRHTDPGDVLSTLFAVQHYAVKHGDVDTAALTDHYRALLARRVAPRVIMKAFLITLAQRLRAA